MTHNIYVSNTLNHAISVPSIDSDNKAHSTTYDISVYYCNTEDRIGFLAILWKHSWVFCHITNILLCKEADTIWKGGNTLYEDSW